MSFGETKVYFDGSHYIAIPHTTRPSRRRPLRQEDTITVVQEETQDSGCNTEPCISLENDKTIFDEQVIEDVEEVAETTQEKPKKERILTKKELFNELYTKYIDSTKKQRKKLIIK